MGGMVWVGEVLKAPVLTRAGGQCCLGVRQGGWASRPQEGRRLGYLKSRSAWCALSKRPGLLYTFVERGHLKTRNCFLESELPAQQPCFPPSLLGFFEESNKGFPDREASSCVIRPRELVGPWPALSLPWLSPVGSRVGLVRRVAGVTGGIAQYGKRNGSAKSIGKPGTQLSMQKSMTSFIPLQKVLVYRESMDNSIEGA